MDGLLNLLIYKQNDERFRTTLRMMITGSTESYFQMPTSCSELNVGLTDLVMEINVRTGIQEEADHSGVALTGSDH